MDQFVDFIIRPPRANYNPNQYLQERDFTISGKSYKRQDLELKNERGHILRCSHYAPLQFPQESIPCVIYCHGNSGCRVDANEVALVLLPSNITVFTLDFSGSGLSEGDYVSLGWHERNDLKVVVSYLRNNKQVSGIGLWGRSMGAVTSLLYGAEDPCISGMVLDSAFSNFSDLLMELAEMYRIRAPKFTVKMAIQYLRRTIQKKADFDITDLNCLRVAPKMHIPVLFGHANDDDFIQPHHTDLICNAYKGGKNVIKFDGNHNSPRPQHYYDSVIIFFRNVLHPPQVPTTDKQKIQSYKQDSHNLRLSVNNSEKLFGEIISSLHSMGVESISPSSLVVSPDPSAATLQPIDENLDEHSINNNEEPNKKKKKEYSSLDLEHNKEEDSACCPMVYDEHNKKILKALPSEVGQSDAKRKKNKKKKKKKNNGESEGSVKPKREKFEKLEALSHRLCLCIQRRTNHQRHHSS